MLVRWLYISKLALLVLLVVTYLLSQQERAQYLLRQHGDERDEDADAYAEEEHGVSARCVPLGTGFNCFTSSLRPPKLVA